ncbi:MAG: hypothetical protein ACFFCO_02640 [Promethearchaeota archaeon]
MPKDKIKPKLADAFDYDDAYACTVEPLQGRDIPELSGEESREYGRFKVVRTGRKPAKEEMESDAWAGDFWVRDSLLFLREGEWREVLWSTIERREFYWERGRYNESRGSPLRHVMYVDIEDRILFIEDERDVLYCSENGFRWFMYQVRPEERPYYGRINKLRKFKLPN